jgi:hypothetical protein
MLDFRKVLLALSVAGLGLVGTASAQVPQCSAGFAAGQFEGYVAVEGITESLAGLAITCNNGATPPAAPTWSGPASFVLTSSVPFENQTITGTTNLDVSVSDGTAADATAATVTGTAGTSTITITFPTVTAGTTTFTIAGLRVNASVAPVAATITVAVSSSTVQVLPASSSVAAAFVSKSISGLAISSAAGLGTSPSACGLGATLSPLATVSLSSGFIDALKTLADISNTAASNNPATLDAKSVAAKQGEVVAFTFTNLNTAGVNYYVPSTIGTAAGFTLTASTAAGVALTPLATPAAAAGLAPLTASGGSGTAYYVVTNSTSPETVPAAEPAPALTGEGGLTIFEIVPSVPAVTSYSTTPIAVSVVLSGTAAPGYPQYSTSQTAYTAVETGTANIGGLLLPCATTLLFPYVVNSDGFDTGIAIANASTGIPAGTSLSPTTAAAGACVVTFYGTGAATASVVYTTPSIASATDASFLTSVQAPGITGYAIAVCNFVGAHGYAFITDGFGGGGRGLSADYLAVVLQAGGAVLSGSLPIPTF